MDLIDSDKLPLDEELETEEVEVAALGGAVLVRGLDLVQRLHLEQRIEKLRKPAGESEELGDAEFLEIIPGVLEICVLDARKRPVKDARRWRIWGGKHLSEAVQLFNVAWRLSGMDLASAEKN